MSDANVFRDCAAHCRDMRDAINETHGPQRIHPCEAAHLTSVVDAIYAELDATGGVLPDDRASVCATRLTTIAAAFEALADAYDKEAGRVQ